MVQTIALITVCGGVLGVLFMIPAIVVFGGDTVLIPADVSVAELYSGDTSQDLKTGYLLGDTPKKQQIGDLIGSVISALTIGGVLILY